MNSSVNSIFLVPKPDFQEEESTNRNEEMKMLRSIQKRLFIVSRKEFIHRSASSSFQWKIPKNFNFAQDVIDFHANNPETQESTAFHHVSESKGTTKWNFQELSQDSKISASGLLSLDPIKRSLIILPRIPEWWILNIAAMRTGMILHIETF